MIDQFDQVAALGASCAATAAAARSRMRHLLALYIRAGGRLVFSTGSDCCSNFSACEGSGTVPALLGLFRVPYCDFRLVLDPVGASVSNGLWTLRGRKAGRHRSESESCLILFLFSSSVFRASPRTAFKCSMQAKARGLLPRIRVVALQGLSLIHI